MKVGVRIILAIILMTIGGMTLQTEINESDDVGEDASVITEEKETAINLIAGEWRLDYELQKIFNPDQRRSGKYYQILSINKNMTYEEKSTLDAAMFGVGYRRADGTTVKAIKTKRGSIEILSINSNSVTFKIRELTAKLVDGRIYYMENGDVDYRACYIRQ